MILFNLVVGLVGIIYLGAFAAAELFSSLLKVAVSDLQELGPAAWAVPAVCLALAGLDWSGRVPLSGHLGKFLAALAVPLLCGGVDVLVRERCSVPSAWACLLSQLLLAGYVLLRERESDPPDRAAALLEQGREVGMAQALWLYLMAAVCVVTCGFGFLLLLFSVFTGATIDSLLDYGGVCGWLLGMLTLHLLQSALFVRGARLAQRNDLKQENSVSSLSLFVPVYNQVQARKLVRQLQLRGTKNYY